MIFNDGVSIQHWTTDGEPVCVSQIVKLWKTDIDRMQFYQNLKALDPGPISAIVLIMYFNYKFKKYVSYLIYKQIIILICQMFHAYSCCFVVVFVPALLSKQEWYMEKL